MTQKDNNHRQRKNKSLEETTDEWIQKAESFMDEAAEKIHKSDSYNKAGKALDKGTKSLFRKAGRWWGKVGK